MPTTGTAFSIRPIELSDLDQWLELSNQVSAYPRDREDFLFSESLRPADEPRLRLGAWTLDGTFAGMADVAFSDEGERLTERARGSVAVLPANRGQGLGRRLADDVERFARDSSVRWIEGEVLEANLPLAMPLLMRLNYCELERYQNSTQAPGRVDLSGLEALRARLRRDGITTTAFSAIDSAARRRSLYRCNMAVHRDMPHEPHVHWQDPPFEVFQRSVFDRPSALPEGLFVALDQGEIVGLTYLLRRPSGEAEVGDTGVLRTHRRRGIGRALKMMATRYAAEHSMSRVYTDNRSDNEAMLALNQQLGFRPGDVVVVFEKTLR